MVLETEYDDLAEHPLFGETRHRVSIMKKSVYIK
jgi:hypothetical protein